MRFMGGRLGAQAAAVETLMEMLPEVLLAAAEAGRRMLQRCFLTLAACSSHHAVAVIDCSITQVLCTRTRPAQRLTAVLSLRQWQLQETLEYTKDAISDSVAPEGLTDETIAAFDANKPFTYQIGFDVQPVLRWKGSYKGLKVRSCACLQCKDGLFSSPGYKYHVWHVSM